MSPAKHGDSQPAVPTTPRRTSTAKHGNPTTPTSKRASAPAAATPKSAPAAAGHGSSHKKKPEPSLLTDFFLGRPTPARVAAQREAMRQRRKSMAADAANVREELRQEMRAAALRRAQHPGGVTDRVKAWQKASAAAMREHGGGIPHAEDAMTEPTEVAVQIPPESVTESDRLRVRMRQKSKNKVRAKANKSEDKENQGSGDGDGDGEETERETPAGRKPGNKPSEPPVVKVKLAPKKRIVSDDNWMKRKDGKIPPRDRSPRTNSGTAPTPIPKDFLQRTAKNPTVQRKIQDWVERVEIPEPPPPPRVKQYHHPKTGATVTVEEDVASAVTSDSGTKPPSKSPSDDGIRVRPMKPGKPKFDSDDGIRVKPGRKREPPDDGIRVRPVDPNMPDDGIRVRPIDDPRPDDDGPAEERSTRAASPKPASVERRTRASSTRRDPSPAPDDVIEVVEYPETEVETPTRRHASGRRTRRRSRSHSPVSRGTKSFGDLHSASETARRIPSPRGSEDGTDMTPPTVLGNKSLADIPFGYSAFSVLDLPVGADARNSTKRPKAQRNPSLKGVPNVFKKVVTGAKDIIQEMAEPPRPVGTNKPQSIESWLNNTVDPFVEPTASSKAAVSQVPVRVSPAEEKESACKPGVDEKKPVPKPPAAEEPVRKAPVEKESVRRPPAKKDSAHKTPVEEKKPVRNASAEEKEPVRKAPAEKKAPAHEPSTEEKRPIRKPPAEEKQPVRKPPAEEKEPTRKPPAEKDLAPKPPKPTSDSQKRVSRALSESRTKQPDVPTASTTSESQSNTDSQYEDSDATPRRTQSPVAQSTGLKRRRATRVAPAPARSTPKKPLRELLKEAFRGESGGHKLPPTVYFSCETDDDEESDYGEDDYEERRRSTDPDRGPPLSDYSSAYYSSTYDSTISSDLSSQGPQRRRPPTNGVHELSTIISEESGDTIGSETLSDVSQTTVTQTTAFTKSTDVSRQRSQKPGLKRRLTKHSDLVSVLSLPDDGHLGAPRRSRSIKSSRSVHRRPSKADKHRVDDLLDEFADDEHLYGRELKALVDGVIPVLLRDVMNKEAKDAEADAMARSVVNMGMALEKLRDFHRRVPLGDIGALFIWFEDVSPVYDHYLDVWRLGFQGLIINLAPKSGRFDDDDSLVNALPLNEAGDIIGEDGERVDVAFLLKRPLIRVKWLVKFLKAAVSVTESHEAERLLSVFTGLQEKARKRHKEESARLMDEDANNTDTSRCRDLRNLSPLDGVMIHKARQVAALDVFSLDFHHSSGQRLECQVEMILRDNQSLPADKGDVLIREIGNGTRSWLLFPPVPMQYISARLGDEDDSLIAMIRGTHNGNEWFELLKLTTNNEEQIDYWLRVLGSHPLPPTTRARPTTVPELASPRSSVTDIPVGERKSSISSHGTSDTERPPTPSRDRTQRLDGPSSPASSASASPERPPTRGYHMHDRTTTQDERQPYWEGPAVHIPRTTRASPNTTPFREDGAPPPPIHRTLGPKSSGHLAPPVDTGFQARLKRRMSSPLKHEYHPSDVSSDSSSSVSDDVSESSESSSDALEEDEVPDTIPGYSIKEPEVTVAESVVSDNSITPSISASQVAPRGQDDTKPERPAQKFVATVSYWSSRKGMWKDINNGEPSSIVIHPGSMEVHHLGERHSDRQAYPLQTSGTSEVDNSHKDAGSVVPLVALILTPVVMIRRSTAVDLEVRSPASPEARLKIEASMFRFRAANQVDAKDLYDAVHISRLNNARYIQLSEEARVRSFGQMQAEVDEGGEGSESSSRRRSWFGRRNSYRASARAPSVSQGSISTTISASSFLRRLMGGGGNNPYNIDECTLDRQRPHSAAPGAGGSLYTSSSGSGSGSRSGSGSITPPRSASISLSGSGSQSRWSYGLAKPFSPDQPLEIRCHLNVQNNRWLDKGDCILHISRPPPGARQELPLYHGLEKRIMVTHATKKVGDRPLILLDAVLGSQCFSMLGRKGIMCSVWENLRDEEGNVGVAPRTGAIAGRVTKWCFQCKSMQQAGWIMGLLTSEVPGLMMG